MKKRFVLFFFSRLTCHENDYSFQVGIRLSRMELQMEIAVIIYTNSYDYIIKSEIFGSFKISKSSL